MHYSVRWSAGLSRCKSPSSGHQKQFHPPFTLWVTTSNVNDMSLILFSCVVFEKRASRYCRRWSILHTPDQSPGLLKIPCINTWLYPSFNFSYWSISTTTGVMDDADIKAGWASDYSPNDLAWAASEINLSRHIVQIQQVWLWSPIKNHQLNYIIVTFSQSPVSLSPWPT